MYSLFRDIVKFFQDNWTFIITNIWVFIFFALIIAFLTFFICKLFYGSKIKKQESSVKQLLSENENVKLNNNKLLDDIKKISTLLDQYDTYRIIDKKNTNTNKDYIEQLTKDFTSTN